LPGHKPNSLIDSPHSVASTISNHLARLIRARAYLSGEISRNEQKAADLNQELAALRERQLALQKEIEDQQSQRVAIDATIRKEAPSIDPNDIQSRKLTPRRVPGRHGDFIKLMITLLKDSPGISTIEMAKLLAPDFETPEGTPEGWEALRRRVKNVMNVLRDKGAVARLPSKPSPTGHKVACWKWIGDDAS